MREDSSKDELDKHIQTVRKEKPENIRQLVDLMREKHVRLMLRKADPVVNLA